MAISENPNNVATNCNFSPKKNPKKPLFSLFFGSAGCEISPKKKRKNK
jgi:hypothetical protein